MRSHLVRQSRVVSARLLILCCLSCCLLVQPGCSPSWRPSGTPETGSVKVVVTAPQALTRQAAITEVEVTLTNGATVMSKRAQLQNGGAEISFPQVLVGHWSATANIRDGEGDIIYTGTARLPVLKGQEARANITLLPANGRVEFYADISNVPSQERIHKVKLYKDSTNLRSQVDITRDPSSTVVQAVLTGIAPRAYDMMVKLYTAEGDILYESPWTTVEVRPGKATAVNWDFSSSSVTVAVGYDTIPPAPAGLECSVTQGAVNLSWQPPSVEENDLAGYTIYRRELPFDGYRIIASTGPETSFQDTDICVGASYAYAVTARDLSGNESTRSNEVRTTVTETATP